MKKLELILKNKEGYEKNFVQEHVSGQKLFDYWELMADIENKIEELTIPDIFLKKVEFVASLFADEEVNAKAIINGIASWDLVETVDRIIDQAMGVETDNPKGSDSVLLNAEADA